MLEGKCVRRLQREERAEKEDRRDPQRRDEQESDQDKRDAERLGEPRRELAPRDRPRTLDGVDAVERRVAHVVDQVARAGGGAVRNEGGERLPPPGWIVEPGSEDDPGEQQQVLGPLAWPE